MHAHTAPVPNGREAIRRVSWGAIFAGAVLAMALMIFFTVLGVAIGASAIDPMQSDRTGGLGWGSAIYMIVTQILSLIAAGYAASRLAGVPRMTASLLHGAAVWAATTVLLAWAAVAGTGALFNAASSVLSATVQGATNVAQAVVPEDISFPDLPSLAGQISTEELPSSVQSTLEQNNISTERLQREAQQAISQVVSQQERQQAIDVMQSTLSDALRSPGDIGSDLKDALDSLVAGPKAVLSEDDRQEVVTMLEQRLGVSPQEADQIMQAIQARIDEAIAQLRQSVDQLQQEALQAAEAAASAISSTAWWMTIASLLGLAASMGGAVLGKPDGLLGDRLEDRFT